MNLWRLHIRPKPNWDINHEDVVNYSINNGIAGIGWAVGRKPRSPEEYAKLARAFYKKNQLSSIAFSNKPQINDLIWTRNLNGVYYLGAIKSKWRYSTKKAHLDLDIPNQRDCEWIKVGNEENIPGKIISCFRPAITFNTVRDETMRQYSQWIYYKKTKDPHFKSTNLTSKITSPEAFFKMISDKDCEDIVGLYLQYKYGYVLIPSSCAYTTMAYEFILKHRKTGKTAVAQVKQGKVNIQNNLTGVADHVYLFSTEGIVRKENKKVTVLTCAELYDFAMSNRHIMPKRIEYWLDS